MDRFSEIREKVLPLLEPYGVLRLGVFGSYARGDYGPKSDIDLLVRFEEPRRKPFTLLDWVRLEREMRHILGRKVELIPEEGLKRHVRPYVEEDLVVLYEKAA